MLADTYILVALCWDANLSKKEDEAIKEALFYFLTSVQTRTT